MGSSRSTTGTRARRAMYRMRALRKKAGMSCQELSNRLAETGCPIPRDVLANMENGRTGSMTIDQAWALAEVFGVSPLYLGDDHCPTCKGAPPAGFICSLCGAEGAEETKIRGIDPSEE